MKPITTERLTITPIDLGETAFMYRYRSNAAASRSPGRIRDPREEVYTFVSRDMHHITDDVDTWVQLVVLRKDAPALIGNIGVHFTGPQNEEAIFGCTLETITQGQGYASEALKAVIDYLITGMRKQCIKTFIDPRHTLSIQLIEQLGFRKQAHIKNSCCLSGKWMDDMVYLLNSHKWKQRKT